MLRVKYDILKDIVSGLKIEYIDGTVSNSLVDKDIKNINDMPFDDFIISYANKEGLEVLYNGYQYPQGLMSGNDIAKRCYTLYPNTVFLPLSDPLLGLMSNFIDEYDEYESPTFVLRAYEVFKILSDEMKGRAIVIFDMDEENI